MAASTARHVCMLASRYAAQPSALRAAPSGQAASTSSPLYSTRLTCSREAMMCMCDSCGSDAHSRVESCDWYAHSRGGQVGAMAQGYACSSGAAAGTSAAAHAPTGSRENSSNSSSRRVHVNCDPSSSKTRPAP